MTRLMTISGLINKGIERFLRVNTIGFRQRLIELRADLEGQVFPAPN